MKEMIGHKLVNSRCMTYTMNSKLICDCIVLFIQTENGQWYKLSVTDGKASIISQIDEPINRTETDTDSIFNYPIKDFPIDSVYTESKISRIQEYLWDGKNDESCGFLLRFENGTEFSLIDDDDCLKFIKGKDENLIKDCVLVDYDGSVS